MKMWLGLAATLLAAGLSSGAAGAQSAPEMKNGAPETRPGETQEQHGRRLLDEMLKALGGEAWMDKQTSVIEGQTAAFFRGEPTGSVVRFVQYKRFASGQGAAALPEVSRTEYLSARGVITPGTKRDVVHLWVDHQGYESTFKGVTPLPEKQVADYYRRQAHSLETIMHTWLKEPGVVILFDGQGMRDRRAVDKVSILAPNNDAVEIEIEQDTHFPLQRSFETRNEQFKDLDIDEEVYGDWRMYQGIATPMNLTNYHNGDMSAQTFYTKVKFNEPLSPDLFDRDKLSMKKK